MLPLGLLNTLDWRSWLISGIQIKPIKSVRKLLNSASLFSMLEHVKLLIEFSSLLLGKMEQLFMYLKKSNPSGISKNSEKERMKNSGNDLTDLLSNVYFCLSIIFLHHLIYHFINKMTPKLIKNSNNTINTTRCTFEVISLC